MAAPGLTIPTRFSANDDYTVGVNRMTNSTDRLLGSLNRLNSIGPKVGIGLKGAFGKVWDYTKAVGIIGGTAATLKFSTDAVMDYETAIQSLQAVTGVDDTQMVGFKKQIAELGITSKKNMTDIAKGFEVVGSAMSQYLEDPKALRQITEAGITLSKAARMELEPSLEAVTNVMNQFQLAANKANKTVQTLTAGEIVGAVRTSEASAMLQEFGAVANNMNVNISESVALIEALGMQMDKTKIGVGARNILTVIGAAGGLDKKARKDMRSAGVDIKFLMDQSHSLSEKLHELSKIAKDPVKMISVFGKENVTAGSVIFNQLATYDKFLAKINTTAEAENQAATNSRTLAVVIDQLKSKWANFLNSNEDAGAALNKVRSAVMYLTDNMEGILSVGMKLAGAWLVWKGAILALKVAVAGYNIILGIENALMLESIALVEGNIVAQKASIITEKAMAVAIAVTTGNWAALNSMMLANPALLVVGGISAIIGATYLLENRIESLNKKYKEKIQLDTTELYSKEIASVKKLALEYYNMGQSIEKATENAAKFKLLGIYEKRTKVESEIKALQQRKKVASNSESAAIIGNWDKDLSEINNQLLNKQEVARKLAAQAASEMAFIKQEQDAGIIGKNINLKGLLQSVNSTSEDSVFRMPKEYSGFSEHINISEQLKNFRAGFNKPATQEDFEKKRLEIVINNKGDSEATVKSGKTQPKSVMPNTKGSWEL